MKYFQDQLIIGVDCFNILLLLFSISNKHLNFIIISTLKFVNQFYRHIKSNAENVIDDEMHNETSTHNNLSTVNDSFVTSTPLKENCGECSDKANCTYCFVLQYSRQ